MLVDLVNADGRFGWSAVAVAMPLSCDRHAVDVTDERSNVWRIDVHDLPRRLVVA